MNIGYTIALIMGAVWLVFKIIEVVRTRKENEQISSATAVEPIKYDDMFVQNDEKSD